MVWTAFHFRIHLAIAVCFAATFIRLGNLFNSEIYGDVTSLPWGFVFELRGETLPQHPVKQKAKPTNYAKSLSK
ncbi:MAG: prolipoprotein diacylglyceryl transferase [Bacteroidales bacterium]|nr:prolipoprotein diacylglyceryl transferase [Bacteroidales bacterium]